ncbi:YdiU family protein [Alcaligenaceae bacterium CGII-47]|nr:YdiU family protein [Alcaligenaceae bacterium CGII-47]
MFNRLDGLKVCNSFASLPENFYTRLSPHAPGAPHLLHANAQVAALLGLSEAALRTPEFLAVCAGQQPLPGGQTLASVYSGHQFGVWAGQLGDGRAHLLGEVITPQGNWEVQLKGSGRTPYSRMGDGKAVLRSSVREYLVSEAMAGLGIPTTRALALVVSDDPVYRETVETAAVVTRVAPSFVRFGHFEHWARSHDEQKALFDYVVDRFYPECRDPEGGEPASDDAVLLRFLRAVVKRTARLMAQWQLAGFCHGVMNTDNMSILGLTIDYGPYGFMDAFKANHVCNHSDTNGRYAWNAQPAVAHWNLYRLASSLMVLGADGATLGAQIEPYEADFLAAYHAQAADKLGVGAWREGDENLLNDWWGLLHTQAADFTLSFRRLARIEQAPEAFLQLFADQQAARHWLTRYQARLQQDARPADEREQKMDRANPLYVLRNHLAQQAIDAATRGDASEIEQLLTILRDPYTERPGYEAYAALPPDWSQELSVSCSS